MSVSKRVAEEQGCILGTIVGYSIRFDRKMDDDTKICFFTDGKLIQEMKNDPLLLKY
jgi:HrpA-like RNA helicase